MFLELRTVSSAIVSEERLTDSGADVCGEKNGPAKARDSIVRNQISVRDGDC